MRAVVSAKDEWQARVILDRRQQELVKHEHWMDNDKTICVAIGEQPDQRPHIVVDEVWL